MPSHPLLLLLLVVPAVAIGSNVARAQATGPPRAAAADGTAPLPNVVHVLTSGVLHDLEAGHSPAHDLLQLPLNHLGLRVVVHDIADGEPPDVDTAQAAGLATWFSAVDQLPAWVWPWLRRQPRPRVLHFGSLAPLARADEPQLKAWLLQFGLGYDGLEIGDPARIEVEFPQPESGPYESRPVYERLHHGPWNLTATNHVWLQTRDLRNPRRPRAPVVSGPWGGIALQPWFLRMGSAHVDRRYYVDPFTFCRQALGWHDRPAADPCVRNGRRMFLLHVDGDGFESASAVEPGRVCGEVFRDRIVDRWRIPMTIGIIVASLTDDYAPAAPSERMLIARSIFERPWVEAASHSVLHPLNWQRMLSPRALPRTVVWYPELRNYRHDMVAEVRDSIAFVDRWLLPPGKRCTVMLWSGAANPLPNAIAAASAAGCWNLNGGLFRWDDLHASVGFVSPWGREFGPELQVFAGATNENDFPGFFTTMPGAYRHVQQTLANTGRDRILKPANVYVHFYSAEHPVRLAALEEVLQHWIEREATIPVPASTYAGSVHDAMRNCRSVQTSAGWRFAGFEGCRTVRFETPMPPIDWRRSHGLLGARRLGQRLFLHLGAAAAEVAFAADAVPWPHLEQANCEIGSATLSPRELQLTVAAGQRRLVVVAGLSAHATVTAAIGGVTSAARSDADGRLELALPDGSALDVAVRLP